MLKKLKEAKAAAVGKMQAALKAAEDEGREMTEAEIKAFDDAKEEIAKINAQIERAETLGKHQADLEAVKPAAARGAAPTNAPGPEAKREFENFGEFMNAVRKGTDARLQWHESPSAENNMDNGGAGGFAVPKQFIPNLMKADQQGAVIRPRATVIPAGYPADAAVSMPALDQQTTNMRGGVVTTWTSEGVASGETDADLKEVTLAPKEVGAYVKVTNRLLNNWAAASQVLENLLRDAIMSAEEYAFMRGDGVGKPLGIINAGATLGVARTTSGTVKFADIANMLGKAKGKALAFAYNRTVLPKLIQMEDANGNSIYIAGDVSKGLPATILGYPAFESEFHPTLNSKGDITLCDYGNYLIKDGSGPFVAMSEHVDFTANKTTVKIMWNVDGQPWLSGALKGEDGESYSPFVVLNAGA